MRAAFQVLVIPFDDSSPEVLFASFMRADAAYVQFIAGGGEDGETPMQAARRELHEESGLSPDGGLIKLRSMATIPVDFISGRIWGSDILVIPEYAFGARTVGRSPRLSSEHTSFAWMNYNDTWSRLRWDSNRNALWELNEALKLGGL